MSGTNASQPSIIDGTSATNIYITPLFHCRARDSRDDGSERMQPLWQSPHPWNSFHCWRRSLTASIFYIGKWRPARIWTMRVLSWVARRPSQLWKIANHQVGRGWPAAFFASDLPTVKLPFAAACARSRATFLNLCQLSNALPRDSAKLRAEPCLRLQSFSLALPNTFYITERNDIKRWLNPSGIFVLHSR